jgi:PAS domain S-box-containing protein
MATGADRCTLYTCEELSSQNLPIYGQVVFVGDAGQSRGGVSITEKSARNRFPLAKYPILYDIIQTQETLVIENIQLDERLTLEEQAFFRQFEGQSIVVNPLVTRSFVTGLLSIEYRIEHPFTERELALYRTLCNQTTIAIENARQIQRTEEALAETQTLYRAGRVLAGAANLQEILQESLVEFVYSLGLDQGGVTLLSPDKQVGSLMAYLEKGQLQNIEKLKFSISEDILYQQDLLAGRPFVSRDAPRDPRLKDFVTFNKEESIKSMLQAPMIIRGETIGWIGADAVRDYRDFTQREVDLARAMADQIAITIQNRRLLEQTELRADRLKAVARVGEVVAGLTELGEVLNLTVDLIRDRFGFYHVSIFLLDEAGEWAVVRASTGEVGKIMVERPHRLGVGSNSIVGYVTANAKPRIALDVGEDAVHFENPLLPDTRSEMALPLISRGTVIGALDVQSVEPNAFTEEDVETLQIMADQLTTAIENARLFEQTRESQAFMKAIINQIPDPIFIKDQEHKWTVVNTAFAEGLLGQPEEKVIGCSDYDYLPKEQADWFWEYDNRMFETGETQETEEVITNSEGELRILYTRKIPLTLTPGEEKPEYLIGIINDITLRKQREAERERLIEETRKTLDRTQTLYRIGDALAAASTDQRGGELPTTFETVLGEYLQLLGLKQGSIILFDKATNSNKVEARYVDGQVVAPHPGLPIAQDLVFQHLQKNLKPIIIDDAQNHSLTKNYPGIDGQGRVTAMLFIPLVIQGQLAGSIVLEVVDEAEAGQPEGSKASAHIFSPSDIDIGEAIADQLTIWLENRRLLQEAQYRSDRLQTAARVSQAASSILDIDELINTSVNLIRDQFGFYYVGLFLVDEAREWAVLRAGTGEAGRIQVERNHRLRIGGGSMIGWSIENRQARIALDVGEEAVHFQKNPFLPDTHSEMALPLISRDEVIGALTVQSVERGAFSDEDITLLQTMADQLANAIENARLFEHSEIRLRETQALQEYSQALSGALQINEITDGFFKACTNILGFDFAIFSLVDPKQQRIKAIAGVGVTEEHLNRANHPLSSKDIMADIIRSGETEIIRGWDDRFDRDIYETEGHENWGVRVFTPIKLRQKNIGLVEVGFNRNPDKVIQGAQVKLLRAFIDQTALALESAQRYEATQKAARREQIIREITGKIRNSVTVDDILKTTVTELGKIVGASQGNITLGIEAEEILPVEEIVPAATGLPDDNLDDSYQTVQTSQHSGDGWAENNVKNGKPASDGEGREASRSNSHGQ